MIEPMSYSSSNAATFFPFIAVASLTLLHLGQASFLRHPAWTAISSMFGLFLGLLLIDVKLPVPTPFVQLIAMSDFQKRFAAFFLIAAIVVAFFLWDYIKKSSEHAEELFCLFQISVLGGLILISANHLVTAFLGLELMAIPTYGMLYYFKEKQNCLEASLKYVLLASFSTAFLMLGFAILYSQSGNLSLAALAQIVADGSHDTPSVAQVAFLLVFIGVVFKLGLAPLHVWMPEVYVGAPMPIAMHLATLSKLAILAFSVRFFWMCKLTATPLLSAIFLAVCLASMVAGSLLVAFEKNPKRVMAYSSMVHMSYLLLPVFQGPNGAFVFGFYTLVYLMAVLSSFGVMTALSHSGREIEHIREFAGLRLKHPVLMLAFSFSLLSLVGLPLTAGFIGKFQVLTLLAGSSEWVLMILIVLSSVTSLYSYVSILSYVWGDDGEAILKRFPIHRSAAAISCALAIFLVAAGIYPEPIFRVLQGLSLNP
jgi:NADH-quinone oxidoreductase subunit N